MSDLSIKLYVIIGLGGSIGAISRYGVSMLFSNVNEFPIATLIANLMGCFLLSYLLHHNSVRKRFPDDIYKAVCVGIIGSFTTFSTFAAETIILWNNDIWEAIAYVVTSICVGLLFCYGGYRLAIRRRVYL